MGERRLLVELNGKSVLGERRLLVELIFIENLGLVVENQ